MAKRKYDPELALRKAAVGICISWSDASPEVASDHVCEGKVTHINPIYRLRAARLWSSTFGHRMTTALPAKWHVRIVGVFDKAGAEIHEERSMEYHGVLNRVNDVALDAVLDIRESIKADEPDASYATTRFEVRCVGI